LASTNPAVVAYDPAFAFELGHIVRDGLRRMYGESPEDIFYYLTIYNEPYPQPAQPENVDVDGILRGMHLYSPAGDADGPRAQILASGVGVNWALDAQRLLREEWGVYADVWSVTSWNELRRDGLATDRHNLLNPNDHRQAYVSQRLNGTPGPVVAVSDWMRAVQEQIREWVPQDFAALGTDGWGMSDTRGALRRHFLVDAQSITVQTLSLLAKRGEFEHHRLSEAIDRYQLADVTAADAGNTEGSG
jgi:pyruvate dehydrogenase E1 component